VKVVLAGIGGGVAIVIVVLALFMGKPSEQYAIFLDPFKDPQTMAINTHVTLQNVGRDPLTNVKVDYGGGTKPDLLPVLNPGEKVILSPPQGSDLKQVTVTCDQNVTVTKPYRTPISLPGMMGS